VTCDDEIGTDDIVGVLRLAGGTAEADYCGRQGGCVDVGGVCHPEWTDADCNDAIGGRDGLWIALHLAGDTPEPEAGCAAVGQYAD
jgi:hypothetical protein